MPGMGIIIRLVISAIAVWIATALVSGIYLETDSVPRQVGTLVLVAAIFGVINAVLRPIIKLIGCVFYIITLGLIAIVVNGLLFLFTGWIADQIGLPFEVENFWSAVLGALIVGVVSWLLNMFVPDKD